MYKERARLPSIQNERVHWLDALKFLGIFAIYLGHYMQEAGNAYRFVFLYHVQLFFFASGCAEALVKRRQSIGQTIIRKAKSILLPYYLFAFLSFVIMLLITHPDGSTVWRLFKQCLFGIREQLFAAPLWFLPCLFVVSVAFAFLKKYVKKPGFLFGITLLLYASTETIFPYRPKVAPRWIWSMDCALHYGVYYGMGYIGFAKLRNLIESKDAKTRRLRNMGAVLVWAYAIALFFAREQMNMWWKDVPILSLAMPLCNAMLLILANAFLAPFVARVPLCCRLGENTLWLCGNEWILKTLVPLALGVVGIHMTIPYPAVAYLYTACLLVFGAYTVVPLEKKLYTYLASWRIKK